MKATNERMTEELVRLIRAYVPESDIGLATLLLVETRELSEPNSSTERIFENMLSIANRLGLRNPISEADKFISLFNSVPQDLSLIDWAEIIESKSGSARVLTPTSVLNEQYAQRISNEPKTILVAEGEKFPRALRPLIEEHHEQEFVITTELTINYLLLKKLVVGLENVEVVQASIYEPKFIDREFDLIISIPNFGTRTLVESQSFMSRDQEAVGLENLLLHTSLGGNLLITLPVRVTYAQNKYAELREFIEQTYQINEISELPEGLLLFTGIKMYFFSISNKKPTGKKITIRKYSLDNPKNRFSVGPISIDEEADIQLDQLKDQGDWNINKIFAAHDDEWVQYQESSIRKLPLSEFAEVFRGKSVSAKDSDGTIGLINISNIGDYAVDYETLEFISGSSRAMMSYFLKNGDVLLTARGTAIRTSVFEEQSYQCIPSANVIAIRPNNDGINSTYLKIFLDSPLGKKMISSVQQGVSALSISYKDLLGLEIPVPDIEEQEQVATKYNEELKLYQETIADAQDRWDKVRDELERF